MTKWELDDKYTQAVMRKYGGAPRVQRRPAERELKDDFKIFHKFSDNQVEVVNRMVAYVANELAIERIDEIMDSVNRCAVAYFNIRFEDMTIKELDQEFRVLDSLMEEDSRKIELLIKECGGNKEMARKNMAAYEAEVRKECESLVADGISQGEATKYLKDKFKDNKVPTTILVNTFKKVKAENEIKEVDPDVVAAAEYIFPEIKEDDEKKDKQEPQKQATEKKKEESNVITPKEVEKPVQAKPRLKIVSKSIVVEGEFGRYQLNDQGLTLGELQFMCMSDIESYESDCKRELELRIAELKEVIQMA